jgi:DNA ligase D-like protein (predicted 3'-phosphoesterase)
MADRLDRYRRKRDFRRTSEPEGKPAKRRGGRTSRFVIQEHQASSHHFDLRLEVDGTLRSWAVPKGLSTDPRVRRLAVPTEDHPLEYADFEGVIPVGEYGAGTVIVWDAGSYRPLGEKDERRTGKNSDFAGQLRAGHAKFWLEGKKLRGGYALTRISKGKDERWLVMKIDDEEADARRKPATTESRSVKTGRTLREVEEEEGEES